MTLEKLFTIIEERKNTMPAGSQVASLFRDGQDRIIQKVGEEAVEVVIAAKNADRTKTVSEIADLMFHLLILLSIKRIPLNDIFKELERRNQTKKIYRARKPFARPGLAKAVIKA